MTDETEQKSDTTTTGDGTGTNAGKDEQKKGGDPNQKTFTQAELDAIVKDRLEREKGKAERQAQKAREEAEAEALKKQGEYKTLAERQAVQLAELEPLGEQVKAVNAQLERYKTALTGYRDAQFRQVPAPIQELLAGRDIVEQIEWLAKNHAPARTVNTNSAQSGKSEPDEKAREEEIKMRFRLK